MNGRLAKAIRRHTRSSALPAVAYEEDRGGPRRLANSDRLQAKRLKQAIKNYKAL